MGLDMYLSKKTNVRSYSDTKKYEVTVTLNGEPLTHVKQDRIEEIVERVGYWRKANHIHNWFVNTVQRGEDNCEEYCVDIDQLKELRELCIKANELVTNSPIKSKETLNYFLSTETFDHIIYDVDDEMIEKLLPTSAGFFFGSYEYDNFYVDSNKYTIELIDSIILESEENTGNWIEYYYRSSW